MTHPNIHDQIAEALQRASTEGSSTARLVIMVGGYSIFAGPTPSNSNDILSIEIEPAAFTAGLYDSLLQKIDKEIDKGLNLKKVIAWARKHNSCYIENNNFSEWSIN